MHRINARNFPVQKVVAHICIPVCGRMCECSRQKTRCLLYHEWKTMGEAIVISALVLAAGESKRMGSMHKALLPVSGSTFLEKIVTELSRTECGELIVVLGAESEKIRERTDLRMARVVINTEWETGQLSSLRAGIRKCSPESEGVLFTLVDHPLIKESTYESIIRLWKKNRHMIVIPTHIGRRGHPTLFPHALYHRLLNDSLPDGARGLFREEKSLTLQIEVDDPGILIDIDTMDDYKRYIGER